MRCDKGAGGVDVEIFGEIGELEREGVIGRVGGHRSTLTDFERKESNAGSGAAIHTVVNDNTGNTQRGFDLRKCADYSAGIGQITLDMDLIGSVVGLGCLPRGQSNLVAFGGKGLSYARADSGPGAENEDDG